MSIKKLTIQNFQSHKYTELEPATAGQLTVIVGPSDSGKTAIVRALKWLLYNRPQGDSFIRVGASMAKVTLETDKGTVVRQRSAGINRYIANQTTLGGFGNDVPLEVQELTGVRQTMIGDMPLNLNLAEQLDGPFLGSNISDPVRARVLGKLAGTEAIDYANKQLGTDLYRRTQDLKRAEEEAARLQEELKRFEHLPRLRELVEELGRVIEQASAGMNQVRGLRNLSTALRDKQAQAEKWQERLDRLAGVDEAEKLSQQIDKNTYHRAKMAGIKGLLECAQEEKDSALQTLQRYHQLDKVREIASNVGLKIERRRQLDSIYTLLHNSEGRRCEAQKSLDKLSRIVGPTETKVTRAAELFERCLKVTYYAGQMRTLDIKSAAARDIIARCEKQIFQYTEAYRDTLLQAGHCPICGGRIDPEKLKGVV